MSDEAVVQTLNAPLIMLMVVGAIVFAIHAGGPSLGGTAAQQAYEAKEIQTREIVSTGIDWCCPPDPSSRSILQDRAMQAWAGDETPLVTTVDPWFPEPGTTEFAVKASWASRNGPVTHTVDLYRSAPAEGKTAGSQQLAKPARQGPAFVVPRLETVAATSSTDVLAVPLDNIWPYNVGPRGAHEDFIETRITYTTTSPSDSQAYTVELSGYREITGAARPAVDVHFTEPDWQRLEAEAETEVIKLNITSDTARAFTQVLTKDDLSAEKALHEGEDVADPEDLDDGQYPHHPFRVEVNITGPGAIDAGARGATDGETRQLDEAYKLTVHVPRNWTDVEIKDPEDTDVNDGSGWTEPSVEELPSGGHRITAFLNVSAEFSQTGTRHVDHPRWVITDGTEINAPFRFHARPPSELESTELGFQDVQATLEAMRFTARETADLTVEVATSPGRVHRTLDVHTPELVPETPWASQDRNTPEGVRLPIGAVFKNGGEGTDVKGIQWTIPQATWPDADRGTVRQLRVIEDYTGPDPDDWTLSERNDTLTVTWTPDPTLGNRTCGALEACPVAATLILDGRGINQRPLWAPPQLFTLYEAEDAQPFVDWFVRSQKAWEGVPVEDDRRPGFRLAHRHPIAEAGPAEGAYRFTLPPTLTPACKEDVEERNRADRARRGDRVYYDLDPREDGLAHVGPECETDELSFLAVAEMGDRYTTDAIGKRVYRSVADLSGQTVASWQNGLAESSLAGPSSVATGEEANFTVELDSLFDQLVHDGVGNLTVEAEIYDPYNAWEGRAWYYQLVRENAGIKEGEAALDDDFDRTVEDPEPVDCEHSAYRKECEHADPGEPIPRAFALPIAIPQATVPGTHLLVLEVSWNVTTADGRDIAETGRLIEPFDVVPPGGGRVQGTALGMTAWDTDWR